MGALLANWTHDGPSLLAAFLASLVEFVEALTVILAVGVVRGWRDALAGTGAATLLLALIVILLGPTLSHLPLTALQLVVGALLLLFGMRWLRKAILRAIGLIPLHNEAAAYADEVQTLERLGRGRGLDRIAFIAAFKITALEGIVVFIVIAIGAGGHHSLVVASLGAAIALLAVVLLGLTLHRPLSRVPENTLKFGVGVLLSAFGTFWVGEGLGLDWPGADGSIPALVVGFLLASLACVAWGRAQMRYPAGGRP